MERPIRVAHLINPIKLYGKEKWLLGLLRHVDRERFPSIVIVIERTSNLELIDALRVQKVPTFFVPVPGKFSMRGVREIADIVERESIDILHAHDSKADIFALAVKRRIGVRLVATPHGWSNEWDVKLRFYQAVDKLALRFFDRVVPISPQGVRSLPFRDPKRTVLIGSFIDTSILPPPGPFDAKLVSFIGRLTPLKRVEDAIEALRFIDDREIRLQIVGDGRLRRPLEELARRLGVDDRVAFLGFRKDALALLGGSAALVILSLTEGTSRVAMEAMALGKPVIGTDIPGNRELIEDGKTGILVPVKSPRAIAAAIVALLGDRERYDSLSRAAKASIEANRSVTTAARRYEALYEDLMRE